MDEQGGEGSQKLGISSKHTFWMPPYKNQFFFASICRL